MNNFQVNYIEAGAALNLKGKKDKEKILLESLHIFLSMVMTLKERVLDVHSHGTSV